MNSVIEIQNLSRTYKRKKALDSVCLEVPEGCVLGLVGENGAGKTTLMRHLMGLLKPESGTVRVFGKDPVAEPEVVLADIGFLSEDRDLPDWMTIHQYLEFRAPFYANWNRELADSLIEQFQLDPSQRIRGLSRGQQARTGLVAAVAIQPRLLLLDEPSSGLDPAVRSDILKQVIRTVNEQGQTVVFSSHLLDEVQQVCDRLAFITKGKITVHERLDDFLERHWEWQVTFPEAPEVGDVPALGVDWKDSKSLTCFTVQAPTEFEAWVAENNGTIRERRHPDLESIFVDIMRTPNAANAETEVRA